MNPKTLCDQNTKEQLAEKVVELRETAHLAIDDIRDALQSSEYNDAITITTALSLCQEGRKALDA